MMKSIRSTTYREYLQDCYEAEKACGQSVSLKNFSAKLGLTESSLRMVLAGKRNLTVHNIHIIGKGLQLSHSQMEIFEALVLRDQAKSPEERQYYAKRLSEKISSLGLTDIRMTESAALKEWFGPALIVYLREHNITKQSFSPQLSATLAQKLGITKAQLEKAVNVLDQAGYLSQNAKKNEHLIFDKVSSANAHMAYVKNSLSHAIRRVDTDYKTRKSLFSVKCISLSQHRLHEFGNDYKSLLENYMADNDSAEESRSAVQVTFSAIPVL